MLVVQVLAGGGVVWLHIKHFVLIMKQQHLDTAYQIR